MAESEAWFNLKPSLKTAAGLGGLAAVTLAVALPGHALATTVFVVESLLQVAPWVIPGILLAASVTASGASDHVADVFKERGVAALLAASLIGAVTPVCGVTVLPLMAGLLAAGVPLAPVMAFWLSSPITDPAMLTATAATLGLDFALGKTLAAFGLGMAGGLVTRCFSHRPWARSPLRANRLVGELGRQSCAGPTTFRWAFWREADRRARFKRECLTITRLILICLIPAFAAEYVLNEFLKPGVVSAYVGADTWWAIPLAVFVGGPAYIDGYVALPLTRALLDNGMSPGAAMAFLISGGVVSIWGAMAIFPVLKLKPFLLYLGLAMSGSLAAGWLFELFG